MSHVNKKPLKMRGKTLLLIFFVHIIFILNNYPQNVLKHNCCIYLSVISPVSWNVPEEYKPANLSN